MIEPQVNALRPCDVADVHKFLAIETRSLQRPRAVRVEITLKTMLALMCQDHATISVVADLDRFE